MCIYKGRLLDTCRRDLFSRSYLKVIRKKNCLRMMSNSCNLWTESKNIFPFPCYLLFDLRWQSIFCHLFISPREMHPYLSLHSACRLDITHRTERDHDKRGIVSGWLERLYLTQPLSSLMDCTALRFASE